MHAEKITVGVNDSGIVVFQWINPGDIVSTINENVKIMDFEDIKEIFENRCSTKEHGPFTE